MNLSLISVFMCLDMGKGRECLRGLSYRGDMGDQERREGEEGERDVEGEAKERQEERGVERQGTWARNGVLYMCVNVDVRIYMYVYSIKAYI